ncbi:hypothetical protein CRYUN_Cryun10bG0028700 [Craigia yunnanensis]
MELPGSTIVCSGDDFQEVYDGCIMAVDGPNALRLLGSQATFEELRVLGVFRYAYSLNLQNVGKTSLPFLLTLNPDYTPKGTLLKWSTSRLIPSVSASKASLEVDKIQGKRGIWFCGERFYHMELDAMTSMGMQLSLVEDGGGVLTFKGSMKKCFLKTVLRVHTPQFYWKVMTEADLGLADAFINRDLSFVDKEDGLLHLFMSIDYRGWWTAPLFTAGLAYAKYFFKHVLRQNSLTQARKNISQHYDLSNDFFSLFLDETMTYSCAVFKVRLAIRKMKISWLHRREISVLNEKARIDSKHKILETGFGWGSLAIEVVKQTGCKYTGITLSEEQLKFAEMKAKKAGLQNFVVRTTLDLNSVTTGNYQATTSATELYLGEFF